jgi:RNA ligase (TIGR02306 family)
MVENKPVLAVVGRVVSVEPIAGADRIQSAVVTCASAGRWSGVVGKDVAVDQVVTVFLQDAILPPDERWAFMEKMKWRVRMAKFKGVPSECLIVSGAPDLPVGTNLTDLIGVVKYEKPLPAQMAGDAVGSFPSFIPRTDEENFQKVPWLVEKMKTESWYATEKADGTSCTVWNDENGMHVCSRNFELKEFSESGGTNIYWRMARKYELQNVSPGFALQFEIVGPGVQSNPMGLAENEIRVFTVWDRLKKKPVGLHSLIDVCGDYPLPMVRVVADSNATSTPNSDSELRKMAEITYLKSGKPGEGVVVRAVNSSWSFKVINLAYRD